MTKSKLLIVAASVALTKVVCLSGCSEPGTSRENHRSALLISADCEYLGASADEVATLVSYQLEETLSTIPHVRKVSSASRSGRATVWVEFEPGTDLYEARQAVAQRLKITASSLPDGAIPMLASPSSDDVLLIVLCAQTVPKAAEQRIQLEGRLRDLAEYSFRPRFLTVSGVSDVMITGGLRKRYEVVASQERLRASNVTLTEMADAIEKANATVGAGDVVESKEVLIRSVGQVQNLEDLANTVIAMQDDRPVRVKDVAEVKVVWIDEDDTEDGTKQKRDPKHFGGVILAIQITPNADRQALSKKIDEVLKQLQDDLPSGIKIERSIENRFDDLVKLTMQKLGRKRPPGWEYQRRSTKEFGDHLVARKADHAIIKIIGPDLKVLRSKADELLARLREVPGVTDLRLDPPADIPVLKIELDREASARLGLSAPSLAKTLSLVIGGKVVTQVREENQMIDVFVESQKTDEGQADIGGHLIRTESGEIVPLNQLAKLKVEAVQSVVYRENLQPVVFVSYRLQGRKRSDAQADIQEALGPAKRSLDRLDDNYRIESGH